MIHLPLPQTPSLSLTRTRTHTDVHLYGAGIPALRGQPLHRQTALPFPRHCSSHTVREKRTYIYTRWIDRKSDHAKELVGAPLDRTKCDPWKDLVFPSAFLAFLSFLFLVGYKVVEGGLFLVLLSLRLPLFL